MSFHAVYYLFSEPAIYERDRKELAAVNVVKTAVFRWVLETSRGGLGCIPVELAKPTSAKHHPFPCQWSTTLTSHFQNKSNHQTTELADAWNLTNIAILILALLS